MSTESTFEGLAKSTSYKSSATADLQSAYKHNISEQDRTTEEDRPAEEEPLECLVYYLFSHSILRLARKPLIRYLQDQATFKPIRHSPSLEIITDLPSMLFGSLPLLISIWALTSYCWIPLCGLMIWERTGSDVVYECLSWILKGFGIVMNVMGTTYEGITTMRTSTVISNGSRRPLQWVDGQMDDDGPRGSLLYPTPVMGPPSTAMVRIR
ncbi:hypothetical protein FVEG_15854 [Fusarium verticillioides 7600]|uniref:Uncharacterized protein n=1 Tax=Gibberella moniliformis (strain M3125 / FGSC 7600) TaxID=334819 RepID=W7M2E8_GIBM7|nr:hypothetical protein FVEG_15854 [Fusarium verticillioides 7600]EWG45728.1 hypothetical protein FVEG_15854 [Fusarium verticillioides 7600]